MFSYISGTLAEKTQNYAVIDVNGIGFKLFTSQCTIADTNCKVGDVATLHTYMYIKEGIMDLYGFSTREELDLFLLLISVNGVGAKGAVSILSVAPSEKIALSIVTDDVALIKQASGIGAKTAQRVILELKDKIAKDLQSDVAASAGVPGPIPAGYISEDAVAALMVLGYSSKEATDAVRKVYQDGMKVEEVVRLALKNI